MPPAVFAFSILVPAHPGHAQPLRDLIRQGIAYAGYEAPEAGRMAEVVEAAAALDSLPPEGDGRTLGLRFSLEADALVVEVEGAHLPPAAPAAGPMDEVSAETRQGRTTYRFVRRLPATAA